MESDILDRAKAVEAAFKISDRIYVIGSLERGVTVYNQQVRAHNLVWALWEISKDTGRSPRRIAVVGGGVAGLTAAACALMLFKTAELTVFEKRWDFCPLQLGSDNRWVHPKIYDWPNSYSRAPSASLPVLTWSEGRASDVARQVAVEFSRYSKACGNRLRIYVGVSHLKISTAARQIEWVGTKAVMVGAFLQTDTSVETSEQFDAIILAAGFGLEIQHGTYQTPSYWRNDQMAQPVLQGGRQHYLVSGYGDGALVDLCRLTITRFRQDTVLYDLFGDQIEDIEAALVQARSRIGSRGCSFEFLNELDTHLKSAQENLSRRIRLDTRVVLHLRGSKAENKSIADVFGNQSSFLNQVLLFMLDRCGGFTASFDELSSVVAELKIPSENVFCRYGTLASEELAKIFVDFEQVEPALQLMKNNQAQKSARLWVPGCFPPPE